MKEGILSEFLSYLASEKSLSPNTLSAYQADINDFFVFCRVKKIAELSPTLKELRSYLASLRARGLHERSLARKASALRQFYRFLLREGRVVQDPAELLTVVRKGSRLPKHLTEEEMVRLIESVGDSGESDIRDRAMLEFWYATGCRVSELKSLEAAHVDWEDGLVKIKGKGGRERLVPLTRTAVAWGKKYQAVRHQWLSRSGRASQQAFFLTRRATEFSRQGIWKIVKRSAKKAGLTRNVWPHMIRHTFATHVLQGGADLRCVQELLGHRSIATTEIYTHLDVENLKQMQLKYHPRN